MIFGESVHKHTNYYEIKVSKHNLWVKCEEHKKSSSFLKDKLLKHKILKVNIKIL